MQVGADGSSEECEPSTLNLEAKEAAGPFHLYTPHASFLRQPEAKHPRQLPIHTHP